RGPLLALAPAGAGGGRQENRGQHGETSASPSLAHLGPLSGSDRTAAGTKAAIRTIREYYSSPSAEVAALPSSGPDPGIHARRHRPLRAAAPTRAAHSAARPPRVRPSRT